MQPTIPQDLAFILPLVAAGLTHWLASDKLAMWKNALIAAIFLLATAILCVWLSGTFLLGSPQASVLAVLAYVVLLMNGSLKAILYYIESIQSPFDKAVPDATSAVSLASVVTKAYIPPSTVPTALILPAGSSPVPPRASADVPPQA